MEGCETFATVGWPVSDFREVTKSVDRLDCVPNLFVVGAPKCGTTSLCDILDSHPDCFCCRPKEPHFFSTTVDDFPPWGERDFESYLMLFEKGGRRRWRIDGSTWYLRSPQTPIAISEVSPDARVIILLRDPVRRAFSSFAFAFQNGWIDDVTFRDAIAREEKEGSKLPWDYQYLESSRYTSQVRRYFEQFGRQRVRVIVSEDFFRDQERVANSLFEWLGCSPSLQTSAKRSNTTKPTWGWERYLKKKGWWEGAAAVYRYLPADARNIAKRVFKRGGKQLAMTDEDRKWLGPRFREEIQDLSNLLDRDLSEFWDAGKP